MKLNSRVTWGLAWAGLALVVAVPSADILTSQFSSGQSAVVIGEAPAKAPATKVALVAPVPAARPAGRDAVAATKPVAPVQSVAQGDPSDPVGKFVSNGKKLPSYITGADTAAVAPKAPTKPVTPPVTQPTTEVAAAPAGKPVTWGESKWATPGGKDPMATASPNLAAPETVTQVAALSPQPELTAPVPMPASMRPKARIVQKPAAIDPQTVASFPGSDRVTARDLRDWESGPLSEFLAKRQGQVAEQPYQQQGRYDPRADGDFVEYDSSPEYIGPVENGSFFIWN